MFDDWPHMHVEKAGPGRGIIHKMKGPWLFEGGETFPELGGMRQLVQIGEFEEFGRGLVIDGMCQLAEAIEPTYTTALIFPAALMADSRRRWLFAGGGDGAAPREALQFRGTEHVRLVDPSRTVIEKTQELIPSFWDGCQKDPRLEIITRDVFTVMREMIARGEQVDVLISDLTDPEDTEYTPFAASTADRLYTEEGLRLFAQCLPEDGVFAMQAQELSFLRHSGHRRLREILTKVFSHVYSYRIFIEFFGYWESFIVASNHDWAWSPQRAMRSPDEIAKVYAGPNAAHYSSSLLFDMPRALGERLV